MASTDPHRGEIWLVSFGTAKRGEPGRNRPAIIVSVDDIFSGLDEELVVVVPLSSSRAPSLLRPAVSPEEGIDQPSVALCRGIRAVARSRLLRQIGRVSPDTLVQAQAALATILGIETPASRDPPTATRS